MATKLHVKKLLIIKKIYFKATMLYYFTPIRMPPILLKGSIFKSEEEHIVFWVNFIAKIWPLFGIISIFPVSQKCSVWGNFIFILIHSNITYGFNSERYFIMSLNNQEMFFNMVHIVKISCFSWEDYYIYFFCDYIKTTRQKSTWGCISIEKRGTFCI